MHPSVHPFCRCILLFASPPPRRVCQGEWLEAMIARKDGTRDHIASSETALREAFVGKSWAEAILWTWRKDSEGPVLLAL